MSNFDLILDRIGPMGRYQIYTIILCSLAVVPSGMHTLLNVYLMATPQHWCHLTALANHSAEFLHMITAPSSGVNEQDPSCYVRDINFTLAWEYFLDNDTEYLNTSDIKPCTTWDYDYQEYGTTAVTKWDLVCSKGILPSVAQALYMLGFLLGACLFGYASDRFGRKVSLYASIIGVIVFGVISSFMPEYWSHVIVRVFVGIMAAGLVTVAFVLVVENVGVTSRTRTGILGMLSFSVGYMILSGVAYLIKDFFWTNLTVSVFPVVFLCYWWLVPESPRWLLTKKRMSEARVVLDKAAKMNRADVDVGELLQEFATLDDTESKTKENHYSILDLLRTPKLRIRTVNILYNWFVNSMVYYGLSMGVADLAGSPYLNLLFSGLVEVAAILLLILVMNLIGRRLIMVFLLVFGGTACIISGLLPPVHTVARTGLSMVGKFAISATFITIYVFTAELYPTVVRTMAVGAGSMSARIGSLLAPFIGRMGIIWPPLPYLIYGLTAVLAGFLSLLFPETLGCKLPDTIEEGENFGMETFNDEEKKTNDIEPSNTFLISEPPQPSNH